jgi:hypothetical protein
MSRRLDGELDRALAGKLEGTLWNVEQSRQLLSRTYRRAIN